MTWPTLPPTGPVEDREEIEDALERWSRRNELDALATITPDGIVIQGPDGDTLCTLPDFATFEDFAHNVDLNPELAVA